MFTKCKETQTWRQMMPKAPSTSDSRQVHANRINDFMNKYSPIKQKQTSTNKVFSKSKDRQLHRTFIQNAGNITRISVNNGNKSLVNNGQIKEIRLLKQKNDDIQLQKIQQIQKQNQCEINKATSKDSNENLQRMMQKNVNKLIIQELKAQFECFKNKVLENLRLQHLYIRETVSKIFNSLGKFQNLNDGNTYNQFKNQKLDSKIESLQQQIKQFSEDNNEISTQHQGNFNNIMHYKEKNNQQAFSVQNTQNTAKTNCQLQNFVNMQNKDSSFKDNTMTKLKFSHLQDQLMNKSDNKRINADQLIRDSSVSCNFNVQREFVSFKIGQEQINPQPNSIKAGQNIRSSINTLTNKVKLADNFISNQTKKQESYLKEQANPSFYIQKNQKNSNISSKAYKSNIVDRETQPIQKTFGPKQQTNACNKFFNALQKLKSQIRDIKQISNNSNQRKTRLSQTGQSQPSIISKT